ncbi:T9SS type A sorting domain-containing protein [candidate division KSB1 bacterium]|nr:T9SS type A sorting domain-containing protein [candidate division KSB1 bacterium]
MSKCAVLAILISLPIVYNLSAGTVYVPDDYKTIQGAIDAVQPGDTIQVAAGRYDETLQIKKSLVIVGSGSGTCVLYKSSTDSLHVLISDATVEIRGMELNGGKYDDTLHYYHGVSRYCIIADFSTLTLYDVQINSYVYYMITVRRGFLKIDHVSLNTRSVKMMCDIGISLVACVAEINYLKQEFGWIDHSVDLNRGTYLGPSSAVFKNCSIWASHKSWGDCIRIFNDVYIEVDHCSFYRAPGGEIPDLGHKGISFSSDTAITGKITNNTFDGIPWAILFYGSATPSNNILVENNLFKDCVHGGIFILNADSDGIDLGGGHLGSKGKNRFTNPAGFDIKLQNTHHDVSAHYNWWSNSDPAIGIWDKWDDPQLGGEVLYLAAPMPPLQLLPANLSTNQSVFSQFKWEYSGSAFYYHLQVALSDGFTDLIFDVPEIVSTEFNPGMLETGMTYFWRVRAFNDMGGSEWSEIFSFQTSLFQPPDPTYPVLPRNGQTEVVFPFTFIWEPVGGEVWYFLEISHNDDFYPVVVADSVYMQNQMLVPVLEPAGLYFWRVRVKGPGGYSEWSPVFNFQTDEGGNSTPHATAARYEFSLSHAYPNPFNAGTTIRYSLARKTNVQILIYAVNGQLVEKMDLGKTGAGEYTYRWNPGSRPSGVYFYQIRTDFFTKAAKCIYVK